MISRLLALSGPIRFVIAVVIAVGSGLSVHAAILWNWEYSGSGITASGTFTTVDVPDASGGYLITSITGTRNGDAITGLQPTGTPIPGNEPFDVDNLVFLGPGPQLTVHGFGFAMAGGTYSNPFYADFLPTPGYLEYFSSPPFVAGTKGPEDSEESVLFLATPVPEPASVVLLLCGAVGLGVLGKQQRFSRFVEQRALKGW